ncbi:Protein GAST1 [Bienertia sinuspersici]
MAMSRNLTLGAICHFDAYCIDIKPECGPRCTTRCSATQFKKPCMFFCQKCCATCLCVPPGTYGNKQLCPCYNNWKTKRGGPKCP